MKNVNKDFTNNEIFKNANEETAHKGTTLVYWTVFINTAMTGLGYSVSNRVARFAMNKYYNIAERHVLRKRAKEAAKVYKSIGL